MLDRTLVRNIHKRCHTEKIIRLVFFDRHLNFSILFLNCIRIQYLSEEMFVVVRRTELVIKMKFSITPRHSHRDPNSALVYTSFSL